MENTIINDKKLNDAQQEALRSAIDNYRFQVQVEFSNLTEPEITRARKKIKAINEVDDIIIGI